LWKEAFEKSEELLKMVGLPKSFLDRFPHELSGGQKQRAAIAMALACKPPCLLADEPTTALDVITQAEIILLLKEITQKNQMTLCMVTHDLPLALSVCDRLAVMHKGEIVEVQTPSGILNNPTHPHTRKLVESIRSIEERGSRT
jgi:peptide/nickel transport system ATP-binding protein